MSEREALFDHVDVVVHVRRIHGKGWESEVAVAGERVGGGTAATPSGAIDVAMEILYGDTNDHLNGYYGALGRLGTEGLMAE